MNRSRFIKSTLATAIATALISATAHATLLWTCGSSQSTFQGVEFQDNNNNYGSKNGSSLTRVSDGTEGTVWKFHKVAADRRCEAKGAAGLTPARGNTYYIGWRFKLSSTHDNNSIFQWKSYGSPMTQNYPVVVKMINGELNFEHYSDGQVKHTLWHHAINAGTYYSLVVKITVSDQASGGNVQFFFGNDTAPETLLTGGTSYTCKTFDGSEVEPKWGYYGETNTTEDDYVSKLKIGTTYNDVKPF